MGVEFIPKPGGAAHGQDTALCPRSGQDRSAEGQDGGRPGGGGRATSRPRASGPRFPAGMRRRGGAARRARRRPGSVPRWRWRDPYPRKLPKARVFCKIYY